MLTKADIEKYFIAEKQESIVFLMLGFAAIIAAMIFLFFIKNNFSRGAAIPALVIGMMMAVVGFTIYNRSDKDRARVVYAYDMNPYDLKNKELSRMQAVGKKFILYRWIEIVMLVTGIFLIIKFNNSNAKTNSWGGDAFWYGLGISLTIMAVAALCADYFAEKRAIAYTELLQRFVNTLH